MKKKHCRNMEDVEKLKDELEKANGRIAELEKELALKTQVIEGLEEKLKEYEGKLEEAPQPILTPLTEMDISWEEDFIIKRLKENNNKMGYRALQSISEEQFEGLRLILKKLKEKGVIDYEGNIPGFSADITLLREP